MKKKYPPVPLSFSYLSPFLTFSHFCLQNRSKYECSPMVSLGTSFHFNFLFTHNIPSKAAGCVLSLPQGKKVRDNYVGPSHQAVLGSEITIWLNDPWFQPLKTRVNKSMEGGVLKKCCIHRGRLIIISFYLWFHWCFSSQTEVVCNFISHCIQIHKANLQCWWENNLIFCQLPFNDLTNFMTGGAVWIIKDFSLPIIYRFEVWLSSSWKGSLIFQTYICKKKRVQERWSRKRNIFLVIQIILFQCSTSVCKLAIKHNRILKWKQFCQAKTEFFHQKYQNELFWHCWNFVPALLKLKPSQKYLISLNNWISTEWHNMMKYGSV